MKRNHPMLYRRSSVSTVSLVGLTALALLTGCAQTPSKPADLMTVDEMKALIIGNTVEGTNAFGAHYQAYHPDSGRVVMKYTESNSTPSIVKGTMAPEAKAICTTWDRKDWGTQCYQYRREGDKVIYQNANYKHDSGSVNVLEGNPFDL